MSTASFVSFQSDVFRLFLESLPRTFHTAGDSMVFQMSKDFSKQAMLTVGKQLGVEVDMDPETIIGLFAQRMKSSGWGVFSPVKMDLDKLDFEIKLSESPYGDLMKEEKTIMSFFYRGVLCGFFEYLTRRPLRIKQDETIDDDGSIIFHICE